MKLTEHFSLEEMTATNSGHENIPDQKQIDSMKLLCEKVLEPLRVMYGKPIHVNSGFRSVQVNASIGGVATSQHCKGEAADIKCENNRELFYIIKQKFIFDQLIWEGGDDNQPAWIHVSYKLANNRNQVLKMKNGKYFKM